MVRLVVARWVDRTMNGVTEDVAASAPHDGAAAAPPLPAGGGEQQQQVQVIKRKKKKWSEHIEGSLQSRCTVEVAPY